jgi:hypothetical protein
VAPAAAIALKLVLALTLRGPVAKVAAVVLHLSSTVRKNSKSAASESFLRDEAGSSPEPPPPPPPLLFSRALTASIALCALALEKVTAPPLIALFDEDWFSTATACMRAVYLVTVLARRRRS